MNAREELYKLVRQIPKGMCASYGQLGQMLPNPASGRTVGRWMSQSPEGLPWWRVPAKDGTIVTGRLDPRLGLEQRVLLEEEGVPFVGEKVDMDACRWEP